MDIDELKRLAEAANAKPPNESKGTDSEFRRAVLAFEEISTPSLVLELIRQMEGLEYAAEANKTLLLASANRLRQQAAPAVPSGWNIRRDGDVLIVQHPDIGGCSVQKEPDWERMIPEAILYSLADALLQSRAVKDSLTTQADCRTCVNRGRVNGLSQETYCESCIYQGRDWRKNHFVDASKTADAVKRRCDACAVLPCSCK